MNIDIAIGRSRKETRWRNKEITWEDLLTKLAKTHRTAETVKEYQKAPKARRDEIKDIGGFVGGLIKSGQRRKGSIIHRQLLTLDVDFATEDIWDLFTLTYDVSAALYSTHSHTPEEPRTRLIMPLSRPVSPDEYEAIARQVAAAIDIEAFDNTTFQPYRLMYWPSTPKDGEYIFEQQEGEWLDADKILASYNDWKDSSEWAVSEAHLDKIAHEAGKQEDPSTKSGVVGAFCRQYNIHEAIAELLPDIYKKARIKNRYTYLPGSTTGGLITYNNLFAYSHHGTDPAVGTLCNAFDLVRIHKFGDKDKGLKEGNNGNRRPSYLAMLDFATNDPKTKKRILDEKRQELATSFGTPVTDEFFASSQKPTKKEAAKAEETTDEGKEDNDNDWMEALDMDRKGNIHPTINNILIILRNDPDFKGRFAYDDFENIEIATKHLPWRRVTKHTRQLTDNDDASIMSHLESVYGISSQQKTKYAQLILAEETKFHPVRDYINKAQWDGKPRIERLFIDYMGADDNEYTRTVSRKALVAAVARVFEPGCKFDNIITLVGKQGIKKSSLLAKLGGDWFSDSFSFNMLKHGGKEAAEQIQGVWIVEIAELSGMAKTEIEATKQFIAKTADRYRRSYGHRVENYLRQCVFFASTNKFDFLRDTTGNRRYWPIYCHEEQITKNPFDIDEEERSQLWAEAMYYYMLGEDLFLDKETEAMAKEVQKAHTEEHPWAELIREYLEKDLPHDWYSYTRDDKMKHLTGTGFTYVTHAGKLSLESYERKDKIKRTKTYLNEIWEECIHLNAYSTPPPIDERSARTIRGIMNTIENWELMSGVMKMPGKGAVRNGYVRIADALIDAEKNDNNETPF